MSDVIKMPRRKPKKPADTLKGKFGDCDSTILQWCAEWRSARAQQQKNWAEHDLATGWDQLHVEGFNLDTSALARMKDIEWHLSHDWEPQTMLAARQLLGICVTILAHQHEDPEHVFADGPVLEIVKNVVASLEKMPGDARFEKPAEPAPKPTEE